MLRWLKNYVEGDRSLKGPDKAAVWGAITIAFFFMLRASEYLVRSNLPDSYEKVLRGCDVDHWLDAAGTRVSTGSKPLKKWSSRYGARRRISTTKVAPETTSARAPSYARWKPLPGCSGISRNVLAGEPRRSNRFVGGQMEPQSSVKKCKRCSK